MEIRTRLFTVVCCYLVFNAGTAIAAGGKSFADVVESYADPTYITIGGGYDSTQNIHFDDIYYEAQISANLNWWNSKSNDKCERAPVDCRPDADLYRLYVPIRLAVRQYTTDSSPVRTPSYNPGIRLVYANKNWINSADDFHFVTAGFHHYSNGQIGPHVDPVTNQINTLDGSFSSDYLEFAWYHVTRNDLIQLFKINYRDYLTSLTWEPDQTDYYETGLLEVAGKLNLKSAFTGGMLDVMVDSMQKTELFVTVGYKFGRDFITPGVEADTADNLQYKVEYIAKPKSWEDMAFYIRWDKGFDYYNINYRNRMNRIQVGLISKKF
jgi:hypothetical protein